VLEGVDGLHLGEKFVQPRDACFGLAILSVLDKVRDLVLSDRTVKDGIAFKDRDLYFIVAGEQERIPLFFSAIFKSELVVGMIGTDKFREFLKGREFGIFG
jgi:hypothetical protein